MAQPTRKPNWPILGYQLVQARAWSGVKESLWRLYHPISTNLCGTDWRFMLSKGKNKPNNQIDFFSIPVFVGFQYQYLRFEN